MSFNREQTYSIFTMWLGILFSNSHYFSLFIKQSFSQNYLFEILYSEIQMNMVTVVVSDFTLFRSNIVL